MNYLVWNNLIAGCLFNPVKAGQDVFLRLTKEEIIELGTTQNDDCTGDEIWRNFISCIKAGLLGSGQHTTIIEKAIYAYNKWKAPGIKRIDGIELKYPPYISYIVFLVLPIIDIADNLNTNNYYDRLERFLQENGIRQNLRNQLKDIEVLWADVAHWANEQNNGASGFFQTRSFTNLSWRYVGKIFSQCIFPPKAIKKLPGLYHRAGMIPGLNYSSEKIRKYLILYGSTILFLPNNVLDIIRRSDSNELGQSIIETVMKDYKKWSGESLLFNDVTGTAIRNNISARIYVQFKLSNTSGKINFSFRLKSSNEYPEDLSFNGINIFEEKDSYSNTLNLPFKNCFELKDSFNKWEARLPEKEVRFFLNAGLLQLSSDYWLETDTLSKVNWMYLLCKNSCKEMVYDWLQSKCEKFEGSDYDGIPQGYFLYKFLNPKEGIQDIPGFSIATDKSIKLVSALRYDFRTYTDDFMPEVEVLNADGTEAVYLNYRNSPDSLLLKRKATSNSRWEIPSDVSRHSDFSLSLQDEIINANEISYKIISSNETVPLLDENKLPKRNSLGLIIEGSADSYAAGSNAIGVSLMRQGPYAHLFKGTWQDTLQSSMLPEYVNSEGNQLLAYLTLKATLTAQEFYVAFELFQTKYYPDQNADMEFNYSRRKKMSLNFYDYSGYLDYEYETKSIVVNPPQLLYIPAERGRKVLLIGGRNALLVGKILAIAPQYGLQVEIVKQLETNKKLLLPDAIIIKSFGDEKKGFGENNLVGFAKELNLKFNNNEFAQVGLQLLCGDIGEYKNYIVAFKETGLTYEGWTKYIFNPEKLRLEMSTDSDIDKSFSLLEYRLRPWEYHHRLWLDGKCYTIDRNWGQYIALRHHGRQVIRKGNGKVAIPVTLQLPRLLAESILLCSGIAPDVRRIENIVYQVYENIPSVFIDNLFFKLGQKPVIDNSL